MAAYCNLCVGVNVESKAAEVPPTYATGWIYVLENPYMPNLFKIGFTKNTVEQRVIESSNHTGVPSPLECVYHCRVTAPAPIEKGAHQMLATYRVAKALFRN